MPTSVSNPTPDPHPGTRNAVPNDDESITIYEVNGCYVTRFGGDPNWRSNNPGGLTHSPDGSIGNDGLGHPIFSSYDSGRAAIRQQLVGDSINGQFTDTTLDKFAKENEMDPHKLVTDVGGAGINTQDTKWPNLTPGEQDRIINIIIHNAGYGKAGYIGIQTDQICPGGSDGSGSSH